MINVYKTVYSFYDFVNYLVACMCNFTKSRLHSSSVSTNKYSDEKNETNYIIKIILVPMRINIKYPLE